MRNRVYMVINILIIIFTPFMMYINISDTKVNVSMADMILTLVGILFLISIKEFFSQRRWLYILYFVGLLLSLFLSQYISQFNDDFLHVKNSVMIMEMIKTIVVAIYFFAAFIFVKSEKDFKLSLIAISLSSIPVISIGIMSYIYFLLKKEFFIGTYKIDILRFFGTFEDPNLCAFFFILVFFISLLNCRILKNKLLRFLMLAISIISLIIIILSMSRGGWLAFAGAVVLFIILNIRRFHKESILIFIFIAVLVLISFDLDYHLQQAKITKQIVTRVQDSLITDTDGTERLHLMKAAFLMGNDNFFFGVGKGSFSLNSYRYLPEDSTQYKMRSIPHNTLLGFYAQQGIVGVLIFVMLPGYIISRMIRSKIKQNLFLIPLFTGLFIHSLTINVENVRFLWYMLGLMLAVEENNINLELIPVTKMNKKVFKLVFMALLLTFIFFYADVSRRMAANISVYNGDVYERQISQISPGEYKILFDIVTDDLPHSVEIYDGQELLKKVEFKSAYGFVCVPIHINKECRVVFRSNEEGWMKVKNAYIIRDSEKVPLYNYVLLPRFIEGWANNRGFLVYLDEPSYKKKFSVENDILDEFEILNGKVIRYSNLTHVFQLDLKSKKRIETNYQIELLLHYHSISDLLPDEYQRNVKTQQFTLYPYTSNWEDGQEYTVMSSRLIASEAFELYGRYYDYVNGLYSQNSYFPIHYSITKENQNIVGLGDSHWINMRYNKDSDEVIHMSNNGWVESGRMNLPKGDYEITFKAKGSFLEEYSKLRLRDCYLNVIAETNLDGTMKDYTIKYHTDEPKEGISFILELVNYKSEEGIGSREVLLKDWVEVK